MKLHPVTRIIILAMAFVQKGWCKHSMAKRENDSNTYPADKEATQFCLIGAIKRATYDLCLDTRDEYNARMIIKAHMPKNHWDIAKWNDTVAKKSDVVKLLKRCAIASVTKERYATKEANNG